MVMIKTILFLALLSISTLLHAQVDSTKKTSTERAALTLGVLNGGGSLVGLDLEVLLSKTFGIQAGAGIKGYGAGMNFHFKPTIRSSFMSLQYWHQGLGDTYVQSLIGPNFVYRGKKWFTFQIGAGYILDEGPEAPLSRNDTPIILMYSIGIYGPF